MTDKPVSLEERSLAFCQGFAAHPAVALVLLFGSLDGGSYVEGRSDIDVYLVLDDGTVPSHSCHFIKEDGLLYHVQFIPAAMYEGAVCGEGHEILCALLSTARIVYDRDGSYAKGIEELRGYPAPLRNKHAFQNLEVLSWLLHRVETDLQRGKEEDIVRNLWDGSVYLCRYLCIEGGIFAAKDTLRILGNEDPSFPPAFGEAMKPRPPAEAIRAYRDLIRRRVLPLVVQRIRAFPWSDCGLSFTALKEHTGTEIMYLWNLLAREGYLEETSRPISFLGADFAEKAFRLTPKAKATA